MFRHPAMAIISKSLILEPRGRVAARRARGERSFIAFCLLSKHLRVSEEVLGDELPGALYVYKRVLNARAVLDRVESLAARAAEPSAQKLSHQPSYPRPLLNESVDDVPSRTWVLPSQCSEARTKRSISVIARC